MLFFIGLYNKPYLHNENLNTSHVILYLRLLKIAIFKQAFKYISCYSLSYGIRSAMLWDCNLNTSHVILYPTGYVRRDCRNANLNTSHVILYLYVYLASLHRRFI